MLACFLLPQLEGEEGRESPGGGRLIRGQFDAELSEEVSHKDPNLTVASFRSLQTFGAKLTATNPSSQQAARDEAMAAKEHEQAELISQAGT